MSHNQTPRLSLAKTQKFLALAEELHQIRSGEAQLARRRKELLDSLVDLTNCTPCVVHNYKLTEVERKGAVDYSTILSEHLPHLDVDLYRKEPSTYWTLTKLRY